ncbi:hypothetical protein C1646_755183 [Rhizophagus diaphanus]|nr:hypothetical protein C1646_755183 [Rhizophagus diaphanus] [Rhizophagus sp. MUCL 43196]
MQKTNNTEEWLIPQFLFEKDEIIHVSGKKLELEAELAEKAHLIKLQEEEITNHEQIKKLGITTEPMKKMNVNFRMFDATKIDMKDIKKKYSWQAVKRVEEKLKDEPVINKFLFGDEQFEDALTSPKLTAISTISRSKEEHDNYNNLNNEFSKRLEGDSNKLNERECFGFG